MKTRICAATIGLVALLVAGIGGYMKGVRDGSAYMSGSVEQLALMQSAKETALYSQMLECLRQGEDQIVAERMESLLDHAIINFGTLYKPGYDTNGWAGKSLAMARDYRAVHPHTPPDAWSAHMYKAAISLNLDPKSSE